MLLNGFDILVEAVYMKHVVNSKLFMCMTCYKKQNKTKQKAKKEEMKNI